jgi:hypothetical protein
MMNEAHNPNANLDPQDPMRDLIQVQPEEVEPEENFYLRHDGGGWPGDGSGMDDLADYNQMEAYDYE